MRLLHLLACAVVAIILTVPIAFGQPVSGTKTIGVDYPTLNAALLALNTNGVGGAVIINVPAGWTETAPAGGDSLGSLVLNPTTSASNTILIQKSGAGTNPLITAFIGTSTTVDGILKLRGVDYVTIDGIDLVDTNTVSPTTKMEWGYALVKLTRAMSANPADTVDGCQYITIKNCTINLSRTNTASVGIYGNNHRSTTTTAYASIVAATGANSYFDIYSNTINNCYSGISITEGTQFLGLNNYIGVNGANTVTNWGGDAATAGNGIYGTAQNNFKINNNIVNGGSRRMTAAATGIYFQTGAGATAEINNNTVTVVDSTITTNAGIRNGAGTTAGGTITISGNIVQNCYITGAGGTMNGIISTGSPLNLIITNNTITNFTLPGTPITSSGSLVGVAISGAPVNVGITNNSVTNFTVPTNATGTITGYSLSLSAGTFPTIMTVSNNTAASLSGGTSTTSFVYGINVTNGSLSGTTSVYGNTVQGLRAYSMNACGIRYLGNAAGSTNNIYTNTISNIVDSVGTNTALTVTGVWYSTNASAGPSYGYVYNNFISDLRSPAAVSAANATGFATTNPPYSILGIFAANSSATGGSFFSAYDNTVYLNATSTGATFGTCGILENTLFNTDLRNNIIVNVSTPGSSAGSSVAHARIDNSTLIHNGLTSYLGTSNNNDFFVDTTAGARRYVYGDSASIATGTADRSITAYKTRMESKDIQSFSVLPPFVNVATRPYDLHMQAVATQIEGGGTPITAPIAVTTDYDGNARASWPDVGADEFSGTAIDSTSPTIVYTPFNVISPIAAHTLTATITDPSGVPTIGTGLPVIYYKVGVSGAYTGVTASSLGSGQYSFAFSPTAVTGDTVFYYVVAQDGAGTQNTGSVKYGGGFTANPPAASIPPGSPHWYRVVASPLSGDYFIRPSALPPDYTTIKNAVRDLNLRGVGGNVRFLLDTTSFTETTPDTIKIYSDSITTASKTVTIKPNTGIVATITDSVTNDGVFDIYNPYITIDGDNGSGGRNLTINNKWAGNSVSAAYVVGLLNGGGIYVPSNCTIKNCNITGGTSAFGNFYPDYGIYLNQTGGGYNSILIDNNGFTKVNQGIQFSGSSTLFATNGQISNNTIGSATSALSCFLQGIIVSYSDNLIISGNEIMGQAAGNANGSNSPGGANAGIVVVSNSTGTKIRKNKIHDFYYNGTSSFGAIGIVVDPGTTVNSGVTEISNNMVYNLKGDCNTENVGTAALGGVTQGVCVNSTGTAPVQIYSNSIYLSGAVLGTTFSGRSFNGSSACIGIRGGSVGAGTIDIRNNILKNSQTRVDTSTPSGAGAHAMGVWVQAVSSTNAIFGNIDYNDYNPDGVRPLVGWLGGQDTTLTQWQTATAKDVHSLTGNPQFVSTTDLHVNTSAATPSVAANVGTAGTGITTDYDGDTRTGTPDVGADEFTLEAPLAFNQLTPANSATNVALNGTVTWDPSSGASAYDVFLDLNPTPTTPLVTNVTGTSAPYSGLSASSQYYWKVVAKNADASTVATGSPFTFATVVPAFVLSASSIAFSDVVLPGSKVDSVMVYNPGTATLTIDSVQSSDGHFVVSPSVPLSIVAGDSAKFYVTFTPVTVGPKAGDVVFYHNAVTSPDTLSVNGAGIILPPDIGIADQTGSRAEGHSILAKPKGGVSMKSGANIIPSRMTYMLAESPRFELIVNNVGPTGVGSYQVGWLLDGIPQAPISNVDSLPVGDTDTLEVTWATPTVGPHTFRAFTILASDPYPTNDSSAVIPFDVLPASVVFRQGFNAYAFPPSGWTTLNQDGNTGGLTTWARDFGWPVQEGTAVAADAYQSANGFLIDDWLITPNTGGLSRPTTTIVDSLSFVLQDADPGLTYPDTVEVLVSTIDANPINFTTVLEVIRVPGSLQKFTYALPTSANRYVAFRYHHFDGGPFGSGSNYFMMDDVRITRVSLSPVFSVSPGSLSYGNVLKDNSKMDSVTVSNLGTTVLNIDSVRVYGGEFTVVESGSSIVVVSGTKKIHISFNPSASGPQTANVVLYHDATGSPDTVTVSGTGVQSVFSLNPTTVNFGSVIKNECAYDTMYVHNLGGFKLTIDSAKVSGGEFLIDETGFVSVAPGDSMRYIASFCPTVTGAQSGIVVFYSSSKSSPDTLWLSGTGVQSAFAASTDTVHIGDVAVPAGSVTDSVTITNAGTSVLLITSVSITGGEFTFGPAGPATIAPLGTKKYGVTFTPTTLGPQTGYLKFTSNAKTSPDTIVVDGVGVLSPKFLTVIPDTFVIAPDPLKPLKFLKSIKRVKPGKPILAGPNWANLLDETTAQGGFQPGASEGDSAGGMVIGKSFMYKKNPGDPLNPKWTAIKIKFDTAWVRLTKWDFKKTIGKNYTDMQKTLKDKIGKHDLYVRGLDSTKNPGDIKRKFLKGPQTYGKMAPGKGKNKLYAELVALKFNIAASQLGKTPAGFGDLIYDDAGTNPYNDMTIMDISAKADTMMTYWKGFTQDNFDSLYNTVYRVNRAFLGVLDTATFYQGGLLSLKGSTALSTVPFLKESARPATRLALTTLETESLEDFEDEEWDDAEDGTPLAAKLYQNYPNPFNPTTNIAFRLLEPSLVTVKIYNLLGQEVATLLNNEEISDEYVTVPFDARNLASGVYFYKVDVRNSETGVVAPLSIQKMMLLK